MIEEFISCPKHVEFHAKNKFVNFVHLVGYYKEICYDVLSHKRKIGAIWIIFKKVNSRITSLSSHHLEIHTDT